MTSGLNLTGTSADNCLTGTAYNDTISAGAGQDTVYGGSGADLIYGGTGNDHLVYGSGPDTVYGGDGNDTIDDASGYNATANAALIFGDAGNDVIYGTAAGDTLDGGTGDDLLWGEGGRDSLFGGDGRDTLRLGEGDDFGAGDAGDDLLIGDAGNDTLDGGTGADSLHGNDGDDRFVVGSITNTQSAGTFAAATGSIKQVNQMTTGFQSPPKMLVMQDGRVLYVWSNDAIHDDVRSMTLQGRIYNADGTAATGQFTLQGLVAIDGFDGYDWDNLDLDLLQDGKVMVSYVRQTGVAGDLDEPVFSILQPTATGMTTVVANVTVQSWDGASSFESPPVTTVLQNGNVLFVWSENAPYDDISSMVLQGRIYNPATHSFVTNDFRIGNVAVDGSDGFDNANLSVIQLANGNIVVGYERSNVEAGFSEPVYTVLDQNGGLVRATAEVEGTDNETQHTPWESPPLLVALPDGRFMAVWVNDGFSDDIATMTMEGRIFNADGTPATGDFRITTSAVDGSNFDIDSLSIKLLPGGRVVVGYPETNITGGATLPEFSIIDTQTGTIVAQRGIAVSTTHPWPGPPILQPLGDSGYFVAVFAEGDAFSGGPSGLNFRIFDSNGNAVTGQIPIVSASSYAAVSGLDGFDWANVQVIYNAASQSFSVGWVGQNDGSGTGVFTTGPISVGNLLTPVTNLEVVVGGEGGEIAGDTLDLTGMTGDVVIEVTGPEAGRVIAAGGQLLFSEIERFELGAGSDSFAGGAGAEVVLAGAGNDSLHGGAGADALFGQDGDDLLTIGAGDQADGGAGDDRIVVIADFGATAVTGGDGGETLGDTLDLTALGETTITFTGSGSGVAVAADGSVAFSAIETVELGAGNDFAIGSTSSERIFAGAGDDALLGDIGSDTLYGQDGNDLILSTPAVFGSFDDNISIALVPDADPFDDRDEVYGGAGNDTIFSGDDSDFLYGEDGDDYIDAGIDADLVYGGAGNDRVYADEGRDLIFGEDGDDLLSGGASDGNDPFAEDDATDVSPSNNADEIYGGAGNDTLSGGDDADFLSGDEGDDVLFGGLDRDVLTGGSGANVLYGGDGSDTFVFTQGEAMTIMDFGTGSGPMDDFDPTNNDFVDLTPYYTSLAEAQDDLTDDDLLNQSVGDFSDNTSMAGGSIQIVGFTAEMLTYDNTLLF